jgi:type I restriction enzyme S subunit
MSATTKVPLSSVVTKTTGGGTPERDNPEFWNGGIPWASVKDFKDGIYRLSKTKEEISEKGLKRSASHLIPAGTPIVCTRMAVGRIARASVPVAINQDLRALHIRDEFDTDYVVWAVDSIRHRIENLAIGSTVKGISIDQLLSFEIEAPPKPEQTKIAEILSTVGRAIEQTEALIAKQQRLKTGLMQDLLTRGIDEHGNLRSEQTHKFKDSPLGRIPVEWECLRLEQMTRVDSPITYGVVQPGKEDENGVRFLRGGDVYGGEIHQEKLRTISRTVSSSYKRTVLEGGELVMSLVGYPGEVAVIPPNLAGSNLARQVALIRLAVEYDANFVMYYLMSVPGKRQVFGSTLGSAQQVVNLKDLRTVLIPLPKPKEQAMSRQKIDGSFLEFKAQTQSLAKLRSLKTALMQDLLTGRKRVTDLLVAKERPQ